VVNDRTEPTGILRTEMDPKLKRFRDTMMGILLTRFL
jgi:hypothetical protein